jgi:putative tryptophan/tyrosine transport system substrate-binding protein
VRIPFPVFQNRQFVAGGGLVAYGGSIPDSHRLKKPGDLPVQQATKVELFINTKTAKALGVSVSPAVLARADEVIG